MSRAALSRLATLFSVLAAVLVPFTAPASAAPGDQIGPVTIVNSATSGHLVPNDLGANHNDDIWMWAWNGATYGSDQWTFDEQMNGYYLIRNNITRKCLKPGLTYFGKTYVTQANCNNSYEFQWLLQYSPYTDLYKIINRSTLQAITPYHNLPNQVVVLDNNTSDAKNWWSLTGF
ncbi:RICIN domain-containing protein [Streptomyces sp. S.PNR 29]|uniref:RICIN domain-containing protein n=1 Tax=Streptomyces sp. S.PNR 29 TaxID=2973805 RepID=UPI0025B1B048|nr:RICIN domain-containing protein [Streptomyces sp. S.PNR 29]MDN0201140.1 RICIN domain-containing protein [Streptomyces sp. S.PNR 29]